MIEPPLISCQRFLDRKVVARKVATFKVFIVRTVEVELRGRCYRLLIDGHHNLAAAKLTGTEPTWRGAPPKFHRLQKRMSPAEFARQMINNLTDSEWYYVDTGEVVEELLAVEKSA